MAPEPTLYEGLQGREAHVKHTCVKPEVQLTPPQSASTSMVQPPRPPLTVTLHVQLCMIPMGAVASVMARGAHQLRFDLRWAAWAAHPHVLCGH